MKRLVMAVALSMTALAGTLTAFLPEGRLQDSLAASMSSTNTVADAASRHYLRLTHMRLNASAGSPVTGSRAAATHSRSSRPGLEQVTLVVRPGPSRKSH
jgi:hypothetical protein